MAVGFLVKDICYVSEATAAVVLCGLEHPSYTVNPDLTSTATRCEFSGGGGSSVDGYLLLKITQTVRNQSGGTSLGSTVTTVPVNLTLCDTSVDYTGGLTLITVQDAQTVAWGIVGAWIAAAAVVWLARLVKG